MAQNRARLRRKFDPLKGYTPAAGGNLGGWGALLRRKPVTECTLERGFLCKTGWKTLQFSACGGVYPLRRLNLRRRRARFLAPGKILDFGPISRKQGGFPARGGGGFPARGIPSTMSYHIPWLMKLKIVFPAAGTNISVLRIENYW